VTAADGTRILRRVHVTIGARQPAAHAPTPVRVQPTAVVVPVDAAPPSSGDSAAPKPKPTATDLGRKPSPDKTEHHKSHPLQTATAFVKDKPGRSIAILVLLFGLGAGIAFLIRIELARILSTRRLG